MRAMILAAGLGTRLRPMTEVAPKPSLPVANQPLLTWQLELLKAVGVREVVINLHWLPEVLPKLLGDGAALGMHLTWVHEPILLDTGGGIRNVAAFLRAPGEPFLVLNGDLLMDFELVQALEAHRKAGAAATMVLREDAYAAQYGIIATDHAGRIVDFVGRAHAPGEVHRRGLFTGVHVFEPEVLDLIPEQPCSINMTAWPALIQRGWPTATCFQQGFWSDVGTPERYLEANLAMLEGALPRLLPAAASARVASDARVAEGAALAANVTVGARASIGAGAKLSRCVVWPDAQVPEDFQLDGGIVWVREGHTAVWRAGEKSSP